MISQYRVTILVKASPQPSKAYAETVCCAGIDDQGKWRRLYPVRFRHLSEDRAFSRWSVVSFKARPPKSDQRWESCHVFEDTISIEGKVSSDVEKSELAIKGLENSEKDAREKGKSLTLIRPQNPHLTWSKRSDDEIAAAKARYENQMRQANLFDEEVRSYQPCPYEFRMRYDDGSGRHNKTCADWETAAAFFNFRRQYGEEKALEFIRSKYCEEYVQSGLVFALGNMAKRPQTWQLLGIFPVKASAQASLF